MSSLEQNSTMAGYTLFRGMKSIKAENTKLYKYLDIIKDCLTKIVKIL